MTCQRKTEDGLRHLIAMATLHKILNKILDRKKSIRDLSDHLILMFLK
jgi:hypothetical protein